MLCEKCKSCIVKVTAADFISMFSEQKIEHLKSLPMLEAIRLCLDVNIVDCIDDANELHIVSMKEIYYKIYHNRLIASLDKKSKLAEDIENNIDAYKNVMSRYILTIISNSDDCSADLMSFYSYMYNKDNVDFTLSLLNVKECREFITDVILIHNVYYPTFQKYIDDNVKKQLNIRKKDKQTQLERLKYNNNFTKKCIKECKEQIDVLNNIIKQK